MEIDTEVATLEVAAHQLGRAMPALTADEAVAFHRAAAPRPCHDRVTGRGWADTSRAARLGGEQHLVQPDASTGSSL